MVFHYTNFIYETNGWWLRRVRPIWVAALVLYSYYLFHRYYFFGKNTALAHQRTSAEVWQQRAQLNKRNWGYNSVYKPTYQKSRKKLIMQTLGENYDYVKPYSQRYMIRSRSIEQIEAEENAY